jgi:hypothetical protein
VSAGDVVAEVERAPATKRRCWASKTPGFPSNEALLPCPPRSAPPEEAAISTSSLARPQATSVSGISSQ